MDFDDEPVVHESEGDANTEMVFQQAVAVCRQQTADRHITWNDLLTNRSTVARPGYELFHEYERDESTKLKSVLLLGNEEMDSFRLSPFVSPDGVMSIQGCKAWKYLRLQDSPTGLSRGPYEGSVVRYTNLSQETLKLKDWADNSPDNPFVSEFLRLRPAVTVLNLGFYDILFGDVASTPAEATAGRFFSYVSKMITSFLWMVKDRASRYNQSYHQLLDRHAFLYVMPPSWYCHTELTALPGMISQDTYIALRRHFFRDMAGGKKVLWQSFRLWPLTPKTPPSAAEDAALGNYILGTRNSRIFLGAVFASIARMVCHRPCCGLAVDFKGLPDRLSRPCPCGPFQAFYSTED